MALREVGGLLGKDGVLGLVLLGDRGLERVVWVGLDEQGAHGLEDARQLGGGLPLVGLEQAEADVAGSVVGDIRVVDAGDEGDLGRGEGVLLGQLDLEAELAVGVGRAGGAGENGMPDGEVVVVGEGGGDAGERAGLEVTKLLEREAC